MKELFDLFSKYPIALVFLIIGVNFISKTVSSIFMCVLNSIIAILYMILSIKFNLPTIRLTGMILYGKNFTRSIDEFNAQEKSMDKKLIEVNDIEETEEFPKAIKFPNRIRK